MSTQNAMQDQSIMNLGSQVTLNTTDNINQQTQIDNMSTQNATQNQSISNLGTQVQTNTTDITNLQSQISNVQSNFVTTSIDPNNISNINTGNVGIGTDLPGEKLDVNGNLKVRGNISNGGSIASGPYSIATGLNTIASGPYSTAMGDASISNGYSTTALGIGSTASGWGATAIGILSSAEGSSSVALGSRAKAYSLSEIALGQFNTAYTLNTPTSPYEFNGADRIFVVGNGTDENNKSDAMVVLKNGNTTINGTTTANSFVKAGGTSSQYLMADGTTTVGPDLSGYATTQASNSVESNLASALNNETIRATAAEYNLQSSLDAETSRAIAAEQALASATKRGTVASNGTVSIGNGFSSYVNTIGYYSITFNTPFTTLPIVVATLQNSPGFISVTNVTTTGFMVVIGNVGGYPMSGSFSFIVMAP